MAVLKVVSFSSVGGGSRDVVGVSCVEDCMRPPRPCGITSSSEVDTTSDLMLAD
jgi:hypothetical protein